MKNIPLWDINVDTWGCGLHETDTPFINYREPYILHSSSTLTEKTYLRYVLNINPFVLTMYDSIISLGKLRHYNECVIPTAEAQMERIRPLL